MRTIYTLILCLPLMLNCMLPPNKKHKANQSQEAATPLANDLHFYSTYHKKKYVEEVFQKCQAVQKFKPVKGLAHFERAINQCDVNSAATILTENNYSPLQKSLADAIRYDDLPDTVYWLHHAQSTEQCVFPLHYAARSGNTFCLKLLLAQGIDINGLDDSGLRALDLAVLQGMTHSMQFLLDQGAHENSLNIHDKTPLFYLIPRFSQERQKPLQWIKDFVRIFVLHAQWDPRQPIEHSAFTGQENAESKIQLTSKEKIERILCARLAFKRAWPLLPQDIFFKIIGHIPEYIVTYRLFVLTLNHIQKSPELLKGLVEKCPFTWFKQIGNNKLLSSSAIEFQDYAYTIAPLVALRRISRLHELITPNIGTPSSLIAECIDEVVLNPTLLHKPILKALGVADEEKA